MQNSVFAISSTKSTAATSRIFCVATLSLQCSVRISLVGFLTPLGIPVHSFLWLSDAYVQRPYFLLSLSLWFPLTCGSHTDLLLPVDMPSLCQTVVTHLANKCSCNWSAFNLRGAEEETRGLVCTAARNSLSHFLGNQGAGSKEGWWGSGGSLSWQGVIQICILSLRFQRFLFHMNYQIGLKGERINNA